MNAARWLWLLPAVLLTMAILLACQPAKATTTFPTGPYSVCLIIGFLCSTNDLIFNNHSFTSSAVDIAAPSASGIIVSPIQTPGGEGFSFASSLIDGELPLSVSRAADIFCNSIGIVGT